jgi:hypothetical protein
MANPYQTPDNADAQAEGFDQPKLGGDLSDDTRGNLGLTANIIKFATVLAALLSVVPVIQVYLSFRFFELPIGWTWWHTLICYRLAYTPCWLLLAWMMWRYASSLNRLAINGTEELEKVIEQQAKMWLAAALLGFVMILGVALPYVVSLGTRATT